MSGIYLDSVNEGYTITTGWAIGHSTIQTTISDSNGAVVSLLINKNGSETLEKRRGGGNRTVKEMVKIQYFFFLKGSSVL